MRTVTVLNSNFTSKKIATVSLHIFPSKKFFGSKFSFILLERFLFFNSIFIPSNKQRIRQKVAAKSTTQKNHSQY